MKGDQGLKGDKGVDGIKGEKVGMKRYDVDCKSTSVCGKGDQGIEGKLGPRGLTGGKGDTGEVSRMILEPPLGKSGMIFQVGIIGPVGAKGWNQSFIVHWKYMRGCCRRQGRPRDSRTHRFTRHRRRTGACGSIRVFTRENRRRLLGSSRIERRYGPRRTYRHPGRNG